MNRLIKIKDIGFLSALALSIWLSSPSLPAKAERVCVVTDPTGTPLNVRAEPNGQIINALRNGREVYIHKTTYDERGRPWVYIGGYYRGNYRYWGWVFREFLSCYNRRYGS